MKINTLAATRLLLAGSVLTLASSAVAQDRFEVQQFHPMPSQTTNYLDVASAETLGAQLWEAGLVIDYASNPLVLNLNDERVASLVASQMTAHVLAAYGITDRIELGLALPVILTQTGDALPRFQDFSAEDAGFGIGDLRLVPRFQLLNQVTEEHPGGLAVALFVDLALPTGDAELYQGEDLRGEPGVAVDYSLASGVRFGMNLSYLIRHDAELENMDVGDSLNVGLAADVPLMEDQLHIVPELNTELSLGAEDLGTEETPMEVLLAARYFVSDSLMVQAGGGLGIFAGYGTPDWRAFAGIAFRAVTDPDADNDGILDVDDLCPLEPEDIDGFEDENGCPDLDNDNDGILDVDDACMMDAEDFDGDRDEDGCPEDDLDADGDGIVDMNDACVDVPEDFDGYEDTDGCPEEDNDGDGILDVNDGDADASGFGACRDQAEDADGFQDEDGCPDPDNDGDGVLDAADGEGGACMNDPEDYDGFEDEDGCPEEGTGQITLRCDAIEIAESVYFDSDSDVIQDRSYDLLNQIATVLRNNTNITRVRVEGHTDDRGDDDHNMDLSQRRAESVRTYLVQQGVTTTLDAEGFGETRPIDDNGTRSGRSNNRRVEFHIVEQTNACE